MATEKKETITANQIIWIVVALCPVGIITLPREINQYAQQSGWMMLLLTYLLVLLFSRFIFILAARYPGKSIIAISNIILGKWLGRSVSLFLILLLIGAPSISVRLLSEGVNTYLMFHTPKSVIILAMLLSVMYVINNGMGTVARFNELVQPFMLLVLLFILLMTLPNTDFSNFLPLISNEFSLRKAVMPSLFPYIALFSIPFLFPYSAQPKQLWRGMCWGILIIFLIVFLLFVFIIALFGPVETNYIEYPSIDMARIIRFAVFERMDILFVTFWIAIEYTLLTILCYLGSFALQQYFAKGSFFLWSLILMSVTLVLSLLPDDIEDTRRLSSFFHGISMGILFMVFPLLVFIDFLKKRVNR
ncbi:MAG: endospore germination permease [Paenibacillaceae bacterium]